MNATLLKVPSLIIAARLLFIGTKPPQKSTKDDNLKLNATFFDRHVGILCQLVRMPFLLRVLSECLAVISVAFPMSPAGQQALSMTCPSGATNALNAFSPSFIVGMALVIFGGGLRIICYRTLGKFFTFEITIRPDHKIVDIGPYGVVRHPSYTGSLFLFIGSILIANGPGTYPWACGLATSSLIIRSLLQVWSVYLVYCIYSLLRRGPIEDRGLHAELGKEWENYAKRVPYRFIPGIM
ncbi:hypothetical protein M422DRAFT_214489 [Sphaerobolus stellatus SS14]|uniref:Protein-S-isoprenylcysteine O-methyltransferase n=1 Tax=Sphaerobolus stellatus (strain SS14) TaxID=990650 RepID=A0A0C9UYU8_SPHS4|nr:hypothetical protein M422DRAFT_214489 [Sphaerobolus stellatus SS14]